MRGVLEMTKSISVFVMAVVGLCAGCSAPDSGDVATAHKASVAAPKSVEQLPKSMPAEARAAAAGAMGQAQAEERRNSDPARLKALRMMNFGH